MRTKPRVLNGRQIFSFLGLRIGKKSAWRIDGCRGETLSLKFFEEFLGLVIQSACFHQPIDRLTQREPILYRFVFRVEQFRRPAKPFEKAPPMVRLVDENSRIAVSALICFRYRSRLAVPGSCGNFAGDTITCN